MAKLYFYYSAMNAGKTTTLLQSAYNYHECGMKTVIFKPIIDSRYPEDKVRSRIGLELDAVAVDRDFDFIKYIKSVDADGNIRCILVDEVQFLAKEQIDQLSYIVDRYRIPVLTYGLRTDFKGNLFDGSMRLLAIADELIEIKTMCMEAMANHDNLNQNPNQINQKICGKKATMNMRLSSNGRPIIDGDQIDIGGNEKYISLCRAHYRAACDNIK